MSETIVDSLQRRRYEIRVDGEVAGFVTYRRQPGQRHREYADLVPEARRAEFDL